MNFSIKNTTKNLLNSFKMSIFVLQNLVTQRLAQIIPKKEISNTLFLVKSKRECIFYSSSQSTPKERELCPQRTYTILSICGQTPLTDDVYSSVNGVFVCVEKKLCQS